MKKELLTTINGMDKKVFYTFVAVVAMLLGLVVFFGVSLSQQKQANEEMLELAELDKKEMENEYDRLTRQYSEMITQINNDSLVEQLTQEQLRTQQLLEELKRVKTNNAAEITRLKKELATVRAVLRSYVLEIDSLNRLNQNLMEENSRIKKQNRAAERTISGLNTEKESLSEKVAIAAQLDATNIQMILRKKKGRVAKKIKDCRQIEVAFTVSKNVTAENGMRSFFVRIGTPAGGVLSSGSTFPYQGRNIEYSMKKDAEYTGSEIDMNLYWNVNEFLEKGTYTVSIFSGGQMIGSQTFTFK